MVSKTTMNRTNGAEEFPPRVVARNLSDLTHDAITLTELQAELFKADLHESVRRLILPGLLLVLAILFAFGCVPVALAALATALTAQAGWSNEISLLTASLVGLLVAGLAGGLGWLLMRRAMSVFNRSKQELMENIQWIKSVAKRREGRHGKVAM